MARVLALEFWKEMASFEEYEVKWWKHLINMQNYSHFHLISGISPNVPSQLTEISNMICFNVSVFNFRAMNGTSHFTNFLQIA